MPATIVETEDYTAVVQGPAGGDPRTAASVRAMGSPLVNRTLWTWKRLQELIGSFCPLGSNAPVAVESVDSTADTITLTSHGLVNTDVVVFLPVGGATLPSPLVAGTSYVVKNATTDTFQLINGLGTLNLTTAGLGAFFVAKRVTPSLYAGTLRVLGASQVADLTRTGRHIPPAGLSLTDANHTIGSSDGERFDLAVPSANRVITIREATAPEPVDGEEIILARPASGAFTYTIKREGSAQNIVVLGASQRGTVTLKVMDPGNTGTKHWYLKSSQGSSITPGSDA